MRLDLNQVCSAYLPFHGASVWPTASSSPLSNINADSQMQLERPVRSGETLPAHDFTRLSGGKIANRAYLARHLGHSALLFGRVGDDDLREQAFGAVRNAGVDLGSVSTASGCPVVDTIGAGDVFNGPSAVACLERTSPRDAALFATAASHLAMTA